jgi:2-oxoglutarate ferredoxin oxidoreductase subunit alpha
MEPEPHFEYSKFNKTAIVSVGSCDGAVKEAMVNLKGRKIGLNYCRVKAFPFSKSVREFIDKHERVFVVEQNRDAQLRSLLTLDLDLDPAKLTSLLHYNGMPLNAEFVIDKVLEKYAKGQAA